jgi:hypothetical protein
MFDSANKKITLGFVTTEEPTTQAADRNQCHWAQWGVCSVTCGTGIQQRSREVPENPDFLEDCEDGTTETRRCYSAQCKGDVFRLKLGCHLRKSACIYALAGPLER